MTTVNLEPPKDRMCPEGILDSYLRYSIHQESPTDFHTWVCISIIAAALGRKCHVSMGMFETYPSMYIILVGESAITHKSTAIKMGTTPLQEAIPELEFLGDCMTAQALTSALAEKSEEEGEAVGFIEGSELAVLLDNAKKDDVLIKRLTDFWDCPSRRAFRTIGRGKESIKNVCINLLGGSTPKWLRSSVPEESLEGGFFSRLILVERPPKGEKNPRPMMTAEQRESIECVKNDLRCIHANMRGEFIVEERAAQYFDEWYHEHNHPEKAQSFMRGYFGRKGDFMLKVAMCLSASYSDDMQITLDDMIVAHKLLNENEKFTENLVKYMGTTEDGSKYVRVLAMVKQNTVNAPPDDTSGYTEEEIRCELYETVVRRGIEHRVLQKKLGHIMRKDDISMAIEALYDAGEIAIKKVGQRGRRIYIYTGKED